MKNIINPIVKKSFGGITLEVYARHFLFGALIATFMMVSLLKGKHGFNASLSFLVFVNALLYPYARIAYEKLVIFLVGNNVFFVNALLMLAAKLVTMLICWAFALFIAPVGLLYLYWVGSRTESI